MDAVTDNLRSGMAWYAVDPSALRASFASFAPYAELLDSAPSLPSNDQAFGLGVPPELISPDECLHGEGVPRCQDKPRLAVGLRGGTVVPRLASVFDGLQGYRQKHG